MKFWGFLLMALRVINRGLKLMTADFNDHEPRLSSKHCTTVICGVSATWQQSQNTATKQTP